jgi:hypothetical protein
MILDNAFLIHHPGLKTNESNAKEKKNKKIYEQRMRANTIISNLDQIYGPKEGCYMWE